MAVDTSLTHQENSESLWIESESIRILMQTRRGTTGLAVFNLSSYRFLASQFVNILQGVQVVLKRLAAFVDGSSATLQSKVGRGSVFKFRVPLTAYASFNTPEQNH